MTKFIRNLIIFILAIIEIFEFPLNINNYQFEYDLLSEINNQRLIYGLNELELSFELCTAAEIRAEEISEIWSHTRPDGTKFDVLIHNIEWSLAGENLAKSKVDVTLATVCDSWMNSESHRKNILNPKFNQCGIAEYISDDICYVALILSD